MVLDFHQVVPPDRGRLEQYRVQQLADYYGDVGGWLSRHPPSGTPVGIGE